MRFLARNILRFINKFIIKIPKLTCNGCLKTDCANDRIYTEDNLCKGYKKREIDKKPKLAKGGLLIDICVLEMADIFHSRFESILPLKDSPETKKGGKQE